MTETAKRTATIISRKDTFFMTIERDGFNKIMGAYKENLLGSKLNFLKSFSFFEKIPRQVLLDIILHEIDFLEPEKNSTIYDEKDPTDYIYFIFEGEVLISKK